MRLVIINSEGDGCTFGFDAVIPFAYESAEQLLVDMENMAIAQIEAYNFGQSKARENYDWFTSVNERNDKHVKGQKKKTEAEINAAAQDFMNEYMARSQEVRDISDPTKFVLISDDGHKIQISQFVDTQYPDDEKMVFVAPTIITVDEWFTTHPTYVIGH